MCADLAHARRARHTRCSAAQRHVNRCVEVLRHAASSPNPARHNQYRQIAGCALGSMIRSIESIYGESIQPEAASLVTRLRCLQIELNGSEPIEQHTSFVNASCVMAALAELLVAHRVRFKQLQACNPVVFPEHTDVGETTTSAFDVTWSAMAALNGFGQNCCNPKLWPCYYDQLALRARVDAVTANVLQEATWM